MADVESKSIPHELSSSHWLKATGQCVLERYLSATMGKRELICLLLFTCYYVVSVGEVSSSSGCLGWATLFYHNTNIPMHYEEIFEGYKNANF